jgi:dephospho-CoA kinase
LTVGLAGKACAGKNTLLPFFTDRGFTVVDADKLGHAALEANREAIVARFGTTHRPDLGRIVFSDPRALADLEAISHPWIAAEIRRQVSAAPSNVVINAALLHKHELFRLCDVVVWVQAPLVQRLLRARARDHWSWKRIVQRIWAQRQLGPHVFPQDVDILVVDTRGTPVESRKRLEARFGPGATLPKEEVTHEIQ